MRLVQVLLGDSGRGPGYPSYRLQGPSQEEPGAHAHDHTPDGASHGQEHQQAAQRVADGRQGPGDLHRPHLVPVQHHGRACHSQSPVGRVGVDEEGLAGLQQGMALGEFLQQDLARVGDDGPVGGLQAEDVAVAAQGVGLRPGQVGLRVLDERLLVGRTPHDLLEMCQLLRESLVEIVAQLVGKDGVDSRCPQGGDEDYAEDEPESEPQSHSAARK